MVDIRSNCPLCLQVVKQHRIEFLPLDPPLDVHATDCRVCGPFKYTREALASFLQIRSGLGDPALTPFGTFAAQRRLAGMPPPVFVPDTFDRADARADIFTLAAARAAFPRTFGERLDRALLLFERRAPAPGDTVEFNWHLDFRLLCANDNRGAAYVVEQLERKELVEKRASDTYRLTTAGWDRVEALQRGGAGASSDTAFIAMSYSSPGNEERQRVISDVLERRVGYRAVVVRTEEFTGDVVAEIKARIRSSRFVVVDLTGQRHNVYFEAGFATGLDLPVFYSCAIEEVEQHRVGFDLEHENTVAYKTLDDLSGRLANRILAKVARRQ